MSRLKEVIKHIVWLNMKLYDGNNSGSDIEKKLDKIIDKQLALLQDGEGKAKYDPTEYSPDCDPFK